MIRHTGTAALTALVVSSVAHRAALGDAGPTLVAAVVALGLALRGAPVLRTVIIGGAVYALASALAGG